MGAMVRPSGFRIAVGEGRRSAAASVEVAEGGELLAGPLGEAATTLRRRRDAQFERLKGVIEGMVPDGDAQAVEGATAVVFLGSLAMIALVVAMEAVLLAVIVVAVLAALAIRVLGHRRLRCAAGDEGRKTVATLVAVILRSRLTLFLRLAIALFTRLIVLVFARRIRLRVLLHVRLRLARLVRRLDEGLGVVAAATILVEVLFRARLELLIVAGGFASRRLEVRRARHRDRRG